MFGMEKQSERQSWFHVLWTRTFQFQKLDFDAKSQNNNDGKQYNF